MQSPLQHQPDPLQEDLPTTEHQDWDFFHALILEGLGRDPVQTSFADLQWTSTKAAIAYELVLMGKTRCSLCSGFGHNAKACPTGKKLKHFSTTGVASTIMRRSKEVAQQYYSRVNSGQEADWSNVPYDERKRQRTDPNQGSMLFSRQA